MGTFHVDRRRALLVLGTVGLTALAGCSTDIDVTLGGSDSGDQTPAATSSGEAAPQTLSAPPGDASVAMSSSTTGTSGSHSLSVRVPDALDGEELGGLTVSYDGAFDLRGVGAALVDVYLGGTLEAARTLSVADVRVAADGSSLSILVDPAPTLAAGEMLIVEYGGVSLPDLPGEYLVTLTVNDAYSDSGAVTVTAERSRIRSTFDGETVEGWRLAGDAQGESSLPNLEADGGNGGGYLSAVDDVQGGVWYWVAPASFRVSDPGFYGGTFTVDLRQSSRSSQFDAVDLRLSGGDVDLVYDFGGTWSHPGTGWTGYAVALDASADWRVDELDGPAATRADIEAVLGDVTRLHVRGEYVEGEDTGNLDNPTLWPPGGDPPTRAAPTPETPTDA